MKIDPAIRKQIVKNALFSLLIYALPVVLMFLTFYVRGERPWEKANPAAHASGAEVRPTGQAD
jgi:hypothetical protein